MASIPLTFTGTIKVPTGIPLNPSSSIPGSYTYPAGISLSSLPMSYTVASSFLATASPSPATVTATLLLPTAVAKIDGQVSLYPGNGVALTLDVALLQVNTAEASSATAGSIIESASQIATISTTSTSSIPTGSASTPSTASTSSAAPTPTNSNASNSQYSTGEFAGVAVGCFIGGLLIAGIVAFFFFRRRRSRQIRNMPNSDKAMSSLHGHGQAVYLAGGKTWEKHLPQSESDHTIRNLANRTLDQIELHVENYYKETMTMPLNDGAKSNFEDLEDAYLDRPMLQLIQETDRPTVVIKHCVASLIISKITAGSGPASANGSFLPAEFMVVLPLSDTRERIANNEAISQWRVLTSYLRPTPEHDVHYQQQRDKAIVAAAQQICQAFGPWARSNDNARHHSLVNIMTRASEFGVTLFAQPASFEWQWSETSGTRSENASLQIAVLPGLYKTTDQDCQRLAAPLHLLEPRMATLRSR